MIYEHYNRISDFGRKDPQVYNWLEKRLNIYKKIYQSNDKEFLVRQIGQLEPPCSASSQLLNKKFGKSKEEIENFYPVGSFEIEYLVFINKMFLSEPYFSLKNTEDLMYNFLYTLDDILTISEDFDLYKLEDTYQYFNSSQFNNNNELINAFYISFLTAIYQVSSLNALTQTINDDLTKDEVLNIVFEIFEKIDQDLLFSQEFLLTNPTLTIEYIRNAHELIRNEFVNQDEEINLYTGSYYNRAKNKIKQSKYFDSDLFQSTLKKIKNLNETGKINLSKNTLNGLNGILLELENSLSTDFNQRLVKFFENLGDNPSDRKIKKEAKKLFKDINLDDLNLHDFLFVIGFLTSIDDKEFVELLTEGA